MTWRQDIDDNIRITCGDGRVYTPLYNITTRSKEYNVSQFNFVEVPGTFVDRRQPKGRTHTLELIFQGDNHLDEVIQFERSADDRRPWTIFHPLINDREIKAQPLSIDFDSTNLIHTKITVSIVETIDLAFPLITNDPIDSGMFMAEATNAMNAAAYVARLPEPSVSDKLQIENDTERAYQAGLLIEKTQEQADQYLNTLNNVRSQVQSTIVDAQLLVDFNIQLLTLPARFTTSVRARLGLLRDQFIELSNLLEQFNSPSSKITYETNGAAIITAMAEAAITVESNEDYGSAVDVMESVEILTSQYNSYIANIESLQTETGDTPESYIPNFDLMTSLDSALNFVVSQLFNVALESRQERSEVLLEDSNPILLAHRYYGLKVDDSTLEEFLNQNNIGIANIFNLPKGTKVIYYV